MVFPRLIDIGEDPATMKDPETCLRRNLEANPTASLLGLLVSKWPIPYTAFCLTFDHKAFHGVVLLSTYPETRWSINCLLRMSVFSGLLPRATSYCSRWRTSGCICVWGSCHRIWYLFFLEARAYFFEKYDLFVLVNFILISCSVTQKLLEICTLIPPETAKVAMESSRSFKNSLNESKFSQLYQHWRY